MVDAERPEKKGKKTPAPWRKMPDENTGGRRRRWRKKPKADRRKKIEERRSILRSGPHVCFSGMGSGCCPGWTISPGTGQCLQHHYATEYNKEIEDKGFTPSCLSALCDQGCKVINGIAMCTCFHGYILGKDGKNCYDIDECSRPQALNPCHQQCKNNIGSYRCICYYGYQISANGRTCLPTKHPNTIAAPGPCGEYGCELSCNDGGCEHVSRVCPLGFRMTETANGVTCTNINDCAASTCEGTCRNTEGGFVCDCGPGLKLAADRTSCLDIDECLTQRSVCQHRCKNIHGSYRCLCGTGFTLQNNGHTCADINECRRPGSSHLCQHFCHNTYGSFFCSCQAGFVLSIDRVSCVDVNECLENTTLCISGSCMNTLGSYVCSCPDGFQSINGGCSGISPMPLKENIIIPTGQPTVLGTNVPCWHNRELRLAGSTWTESGCSDCICKEGKVSCARRVCNPDCSHPVLTPESCCPSCDGCSYGRRTYRNNESFPSTSDPCLTCICLVGTVACSPIECAPNCTYPFHDEGECCPVCRDCTYEGRKVLNHQTFSLESEPCTQCTCQEGEVQCEAMSCSTTCSHPYIFPGECCAACEECTFEGHVLENGGSYILKSDPCVVCHCYAGNVQCEQSEGSCTPCEQKTQDCQNEVSEPFNTKQLQYSPQNAGQVNVPLKILSATKSPAFGRLSLSQKLKERRNLVTAASFSPVSRSVPSDHVSHSESVSALEHKLNSNTMSHIQIHPVPPGEEKVSVHSYVHMSSTPSGVSVSPSLPGQPVPTSETIKDTTSHPTSNWSLWSFHSNLFSDSQTSATVADPSLFPATTSTSGHPQSYTPSSSSQATVANRASAKDVLMPLHDRGTLSPSMNDSNTPLYTSKAQEESGPTTRHTDYVYQLTDVAKLSFEKMENAEETDYEPRLLTDCNYAAPYAANCGALCVLTPFYLKKYCIFQQLQIQ
ncbi:hypothetical protein AB205_0134120 [Aquarana catesbeiana]|uniref:von Willebrand factor C and EGF domain-containing protein n=1 Tax=Aquarana catesbeiana TaxID=8400 RepID=A0A2G9S4Z6_AQUCT|nr:hypothetical protein AB205_0134120 [Aquarana catesbeiana]